MATSELRDAELHITMYLRCAARGRLGRWIPKGLEATQRHILFANRAGIHEPKLRAN